MQGKERKAFVQSFFLATQERGYFVLNDTFRFLSEPVKGFSSDLAASEVNGANQQYRGHQEVGMAAISMIASFVGQTRAKHKTAPFEISLELVSESACKHCLLGEVAYGVLGGAQSFHHVSNWLSRLDASCLALHVTEIQLQASGSNYLGLHV